MPNNFVPVQIQTQTPLLLDRTHTPRGALKTITLERNFSMKKWLYNKNTCDKFDPDRTAHEIKRSKKLRQITRRQEKKKASFELTQSKRRSACDGFLSNSMTEF